MKVVNGKNYWWDMYSNELVLVSSGHGGLNIEHSVANSWWEGTKNDAYKDIHHLNPSNATANSRKGNFPLGKVGTVTWTNGVTTVGKPTGGTGGGSANVYEPCDEYKGDFARVFMYMFTCYEDMSWGSRFDWMYVQGQKYPMFQSWAVDLLLDWNALDPVSDKEINRNEAIYSIQKTAIRSSTCLIWPLTSGATRRICRLCSMTLRASLSCFSPRRAPRSRPAM